MEIWIILGVVALVGIAIFGKIAETRARENMLTKLRGQDSKAQVTVGTLHPPSRQAEIDASFEGLSAAELHEKFSNEIEATNQLHASFEESRLPIGHYMESMNVRSSTMQMLMDELIAKESVFFAQPSMLNMEATKAIQDESLAECDRITEQMQEYLRVNGTDFDQGSDPVWLDMQLMLSAADARFRKSLNEYQKESDDWCAAMDKSTKEREARSSPDLLNDALALQASTLDRYSSNLMSSAHMIEGGDLTQPYPAPSTVVSFKISENFIGTTHPFNGIAIDRGSRQIALLSSFAQTVVPYQNILRSEVCIDSETLVATDRVGQIGGALLGGALTGGFGAVVMAMGAKKKEVSKIKRIELKIVTVQTTDPVHLVHFFPSSFVSAEEALQSATRWHDLLAVAVRESEMTTDSIRSTERSSVGIAPSLADELNKLATLRQQGMLSESEYTAAKTRLL